MTQYRRRRQKSVFAGKYRENPDDFEVGLPEN